MRSAERRLVSGTVTKEQFCIPGHRLAARSRGTYWRGGRIYFAIGCYRHSWVCDRKVQVFRKGRLTREKPERSAAACKTGLGRAPEKTRLKPRVPKLPPQRTYYALADLFRKPALSFTPGHWASRFRVNRAQLE